MINEARTGRQLLKFFCLLVILAACWYLGRIFDVDVEYYQRILARFPVALSGLIFVALYVVTTTFMWFGPKDVLRIASAILFGPYVSTVFVWAGEMVNAGVMFHLSRVLGQEYVQRRLGVKAEELEKMKNDASFLGVVALRVNPLVPFRLMDLGYGLTPIGFKKYAVAIAGVSVLRIFWLQYILAGIGTGLFASPSAMQDYLLANPVVFAYSMLYFGVVAIITVIAVIAKIMKKKRKGP